MTRGSLIKVLEDLPALRKYIQEHRCAKYELPHWIWNKVSASKQGKCVNRKSGRNYNNLNSLDGGRVVPYLRNDNYILDAEEDALSIH